MVKVISLSEPAYAFLAHKKKGTESFSDVVLRLGDKKPRPDIENFFGAWPSGKEELTRIGTIITEDRKKFKLAEVRF